LKKDERSIQSKTMFDEKAILLVSAGGKEVRREDGSRSSSKPPPLTGWGVLKIVQLSKGDGLVEARKKEKREKLGGSTLGQGGKSKTITANLKFSSKTRRKRRGLNKGTTEIQRNIAKNQKKQK